MHLTTENPSAPSFKSTGILSRAKRLGAGVAFALAPMAASVELSAGPMTLDYSAVGSYTNSGWFTGVLDESKADGIVLNNGFKLWGSETRDDSMFWQYSNLYQQLMPTYDTSGISFIWGGKITGGATSSDKLSAPFDFSTAFTYTNPQPGQYPYIGFSGQLKLGYSHQAYVPQDYYTGPASNAANYTSTGFYYTEAGYHQEIGNLSLNLTDTAEDLYWFAQLEVNWNHEMVSNAYWNGSYATLNGDQLTVTIPQNSIDVAFLPANNNPDPVPDNSVPDAGTTGVLFGLAMLGLVGFRRRR